MIRCNDELHDVGPPWLGNDVALLNWPLHQADIDVLRGHLFGDIAGIGADEVQIYARMGPMECAEITGDLVRRDGGAGADQQRAVVQSAKRGEFFISGAFHCEKRFSMSRQRQP